MDAFRTLALLLLLAAGSTQIQAQEQIEPFVPVEGRVTAGGEQSWQFSAGEGEVIAVLVTPANAAFDPVVSLSSSSGELIRNDDFDYPTDTRAILEAITLPRRDTYTLRVSGFGESAGAFTAELLRGFGAVIPAGGEWAGGDNLLIEAMETQVALVLNGASQRGLARLADTTVPADQYVETSVLEISGRGGWRAGLALRVQDTGYYLFEVDDRGQWRFLVHEDGTDLVIRDWLTHPAISSGTTAFKLAVLARGSAFELFYNDIFISRQTDSALEDAGQAGLVVETLNVPDSETIARFSPPRITTPLAGAVLPQQLIVGNQAVMLQELQRRGLIPPEGRSQLTISESFVTLNQPGVNEILLGGGQRYTNFVIASTVSWDIQGSDAAAGCGLVLRAQNDADYTLAYVDQTGAYGAVTRRDDRFQAGLYGERPGGGSSAHLLVIVDGDQLIYYVNGLLAGTTENPPINGQIGSAALNFEPVTTNCTFRNIWLWGW